MRPLSADETGILEPGPREETSFHVVTDPQLAAVSRITRAVAETLELREVFARVAEAAAGILPFEGMTAYNDFSNETHTFSVAAAGSISTLTQANFNLAGEASYTLIAFGTLLLRT